MYKEKILIASTDTDCNLELRVSNLFKIFQLVGFHHIRALKLGQDELDKHNLLWVLVRMDVNIYRTPKLDEEILVTTHPGEKRSFIFPRYYQIYDKKGNLIINVSSLWALIDKDTRKVSIKPDMINIKGETSKVDMPQPEKVVGDSALLADTRKVRYTDVDMNGHLNNTSYIEYILNIHDNDFYKSHRIKSIRINYDKEIKPTDIVNIYSNGGVPEIIKGKVGDSNNFTAEIDYEER